MPEYSTKSDQAKWDQAKWDQGKWDQARSTGTTLLLPEYSTIEAPDQCLQYPSGVSVCAA